MECFRPPCKIGLPLFSPANWNRMELLFCCVYGGDNFVWFLRGIVKRGKNSASGKCKSFADGRCCLLWVFQTVQANNHLPKLFPSHRCSNAPVHFIALRQRMPRGWIHKLRIHKSINVLNWCLTHKAAVLKVTIKIHRIGRFSKISPYSLKNKFNYKIKKKSYILNKFKVTYR